MNSEYCKHCLDRYECYHQKPTPMYGDDYCRKHGTKTIHYECGEEKALYPKEYVGKPLQSWKYIRD